MKKSKNVLIVGMGRSIKNVGSAIAKKFKNKEWNVIGADIVGQDHDIVDDFYKVDVSDYDSVVGLFDYIEKNYETLDAVINSAGVNEMENLFNYTEEMWDKTIDVNLKGQFLLLQQYAKRYNFEPYQKNFISITSHTGMIPKSATFAYGASKAGANHFIRCAARELNKYHGGENWVVVGFAAGMIENTPMDLDIKKELIVKMDGVENLQDAHDVLIKNIP